MAQVSMKKLIAFALIIVMILAFPVLAADEKIWTTLTTDLDAKGREIKQSLYGYYSELSNGIEIFIVCDPATGEETGNAYIPNIKLGEDDRLTNYEYFSGLDWDNPTAVRVPNISLMMPNIITSFGYDWDYWEDTGELRHIGKNEFGWPGDIEGYMVAGNNPEDWMIVAVLTNTNSKPVEITLYADVREWDRGEPIGLSGAAIDFAPYETKYILLNRGKRADVLADESGRTEAYYRVETTKVLDPAYPDILRDGIYTSLYFPYTRQYGMTSPVSATIPMRLSYTFRAYGRSNGYTTWPSVYGRANYDHIEKRWNIVELRGTDGGLTQEQIAYATQDLQNLFNRWGIKPPHFSVWNNNETKFIDRNTGAITTDYRNYIGFDYNEPHTPNGWEYSGRSIPASTGFDLYSGAVAQFNGQNTRELNWVTLSNSGFWVGDGTYMRNSVTDPNYYDPDGWMKNIPVLKSEPVFIEKYSFIETEGVSGYITKSVEPGLRTWVENEPRPVINIVSEPVEMNIRYRQYSDSQWHQYKWTPGNGLQNLGATTNYSWPFISDGTTNWHVEVKYTQSITGENTGDYKIQWGETGSAISICWVNSSELRDKFAALAGTMSSGCGGVEVPMLDEVSIPLAGTVPAPVIMPNTTKALSAPALKTATIRFRTGTAADTGGCAPVPGTGGPAPSTILEQVCSTIPLVVGKETEGAFQSNYSFYFDSLPGDVVQIMGAAKKNLEHRNWYVSYYPKYDAYFDRWTCTEVGAGPDWTLLSYFSSGSPTKGVICRPRDAVFASNKYFTVSKYWRIANGGGWLPGDYYLD